MCFKTPALALAHYFPFILAYILTHLYQSIHNIYIYLWTCEKSNQVNPPPTPQNAFPPQHADLTQPRRLTGLHIPNLN